MPADHRDAHRPPRTAAAALAAACALTAAGCGAAPRPDTAELEARIAADRAAEASAAPEPAPSEMRFAPGSAACEPRASTAVPGEWETSAPRKPLDGDPAPLGLRDAAGGADLAVRADVAGPDGALGGAEAQASGDSWAELEFPGDFVAADPGKGTYTVVWSSAEDGAFISCDGFRVK
ncbi:hypothetical protein O4J56_15235 [Nocardiopsis sp. RSe5-2]|uniref:Lipoprotein n=1 Tax=Nocardiopsis endophytica TaxID=3018445 RepID=A0ABT4U4X4_9ACTN|nr:hypothetical protein [Nocardiopsis endophytica]MDA2811995.1 hypothetical protein [Nocardiopsis endophytica]